LALASVFFTGMDFLTGAFTSYLLTDPVAHSCALRPLCGLSRVMPCMGGLADW
jgi:hypothetical protein